MNTLMKTLLMLGSLSIAALMTSCQAPSSTMPTSAVTCSKCGTVSFMAPAPTSGSGGSNIAGGKGFVTLKSSSRMTCADCENKIVGWSKGGTFTEHTCKSCGGAMKHCTNH